MSIGSFADAVIGLAREYKTKEKRVNWAADFAPDLTFQLLEQGYFTELEAEKFVEALEILIQNSSPKRKQKK